MYGIESTAMQKETSILTAVILLVILALAISAIPVAEKLNDLLVRPIEKIKVGQMMKV